MSQASQTHPDEVVEPTQRSADGEEAHLLSTQSNVPDYFKALDDLEIEAAQEFSDLKSKVSSNIDPSQGVRERLLVVAKEAWSMSGAGEVDPVNLPGLLQSAAPDGQEKFHAAWTKLVYDVKEVYQAIGFHHKPPQTSLREFIKSHSETFFADLLSRTLPDPLKAQKETSLQSMCPLVIAHACQRLAVGNGLPPDGHVLFSAFQGQCAYYWNGAEGALQNPPLAESESKWNIGATTLPLIVAGDSAAGKDNAKRVVLGWLESLKSERLPATNALLQGASPA